MAANFIEIHEEPIISLIFKNFIPIKIERNSGGFDGDFIYYGYSSLFDEVEEGTIIPEYEFVIEQNKFGELSIRTLKK